MIARRLAAVALVAACVLALGERVQARSAFDGYWSVAVYGRTGSCAGGTYQYNVQIINGIVRYLGGDAQISGRVSPSGAVYVRVVSGDRSAAGAGRLSRSSGGGSFHGRSSSGACSGTWSAQRSG